MITGRKTAEALGAAAAVVLWAVLAASTCRAAEWLEGTVELSTGRTIRGQVYVVGDHLYLYNQARRRRYRIPTSDIRQIETVVEKELMARKWLFKEDGRDVKVYTGERYPVRYYRTRITFHNGAAMDGHIIGKTLYVKGEDTRTRLQLRRKDEGAVDEKPEDLVYVKRVTFGGEGPGVSGTIAGTLRLPPKEKLGKILAINTRDHLILEGETGNDGRSFRFEDCTRGTWDLVVVTDRALYLFFSREKDKKCSRLHRKAVAGVQAWVNKLRDFFHAQDVVYAAGNEKETLALVRKERHGGTTLPGAALIRRYDVWIMHKPRDQWQIKKRLFVAREVSKKEDDPREAVVLVPALGGHVIDAENPRQNLQLALKRNDLDPIPEPEKDREGEGDGPEGPQVEDARHVE